MPIFDRVKHGVDITKFKADQLLRVNRAKSEIDGLNQNAMQLQRKIAAKAMELHLDGNLGNSELEELCQGIDEVKRQIRNKEAEIAAIRAEEIPVFVPEMPKQAVYPCPACGFAMPLTADFCPNCGQSVTQRIHSELEETVKEGVICGSCGSMVSEKAAFCSECGNKMKQAE